MTRGPWRIAAALALVLGVAAPARAMDVLPLGFDELVDRAARIVHGTVREVTSGRDADGIPATWITLDVAECLKGRDERTVTIKQFGVEEPLADGTLLRLPGIPRYHAGDEVVLFLHEPSGRGFTSPVGLGLGFYRAERTATGRAVRAARPTRAAEDLPAFLERIRRRAGR